MACKNCDTHWFWKKIGRCTRCMKQLTFLSILGWLVWWFGFRLHPKSVEAVALLFATLAFNGLLLLHLWFRFIQIPLRQKYRKQPRRKK
ncbi:DUF3624 domain-containing protein [Vibrio albus]|uniref:DUF3624 domain-containing protein n=1 Tax=Vibrio albus TaxID=2200953 RepID=A0A2U3BAB3_9VIBR|nr:DUF3624 domain-containing protein [Vibrio albus]PWI33703.1 DUF3624 domain-containing protein [Vibrio albus]